MDVVYIIGTGSVWQNNELRHSLRSLQQYAQDLGEVMIVGYKPNWVKNVQHINCADPYPRKCDNAWHKIVNACKRRTEPFVLMNDDFYLLRDVVLSKMPMYVDGMIEDLIVQNRGSSPYRQCMEATVEWLVEHGLPMLNYALHVPMIVDPVHVLEVYGKVGGGAGLSFRNIYGNYFADVEVSKQGDLKLSQPMHSNQEINDALKGATFFSHGDKFLNDVGKRYLQLRYSRKSRYEV